MSRVAHVEQPATAERAAVRGSRRVAAVSAELALLEQQQKAQAALDEKVAEAAALPGKVQTKLATTVDETVDAVKKAPQRTADKITNKVRDTLAGIQGDARQQLDAAKREIDSRKR